MLEADGQPVAICFCAGTLITTHYGEVAVEDLSTGDQVLTADNGYQAILWVGGNTLSAADLEQHPNLRPIRIQAGALGENLPSEDLVVSPQHRILIRSNIVERMFTEKEVLVAAKKLVVLDGIDIAHDIDEVTYVHFLFDQHEIVFSNGAQTESLYTGPEALKAVSPEGRQEILSLFPELAGIDYKALSARKLANGRMGRKLAIRHKNSNKSLVEEHL